MQHQRASCPRQWRAAGEKRGKAQGACPTALAMRVASREWLQVVVDGALADKAAWAADAKFGSTFEG